VELINRAEHEIDMAAYVLTDWPVMQALTRAADRGVHVRIYLDGALTDGLANSKASTRLIFFRLTWRRRDSPAHALIDCTLVLRAKFPLTALHGVVPFAGGQKDKWQHKKKHSHLATKRPIRRNLSRA